jgi:hypothetical protein
MMLAIVHGFRRSVDGWAAVVVEIPTSQLDPKFARDEAIRKAEMDQVCNARVVGWR